MGIRHIVFTAVIFSILHCPLERCTLMLIPWFRMGGSDVINLDILEHITVKEHKQRVVIIPTENVTFADTWKSYFATYTDDILHVVNIPEIIRTRDIRTIYISNSDGGTMMLPSLRKEFPNLHVVSLEHMIEPWRSGGFTRTNVDMTEYFDSHVTVSQHVKNWMIENGVDAKKIHVCRNGVDIVSPDISPNRKFPDTLRITFASRIVHQKKPWVMVEVANILRHRGISFVVNVVGDGGLLDRMRDMVGRLDLNPHFHFTGMMCHSEALEYLRNYTDVFIQPSANEGLSLTLLEAMEAGIPSIATDVGGHSDVVGSDTGWIFQPEPDWTLIQNIADTIEYMIHNESEVNRRSINAQYHIRKSFDKKAFLDCFLRILHII